MGASNYLARRSEADAVEDPARRLVARNGLATFVGFVTAGVIPLTAYLVPLPDHARYAVAIGLTLSSLFLVGASRAFVRIRGFLRSGLEMLLVGSAAAALAYVVGALAAELTGCQTF